MIATRTSAVAVAQISHSPANCVASVILAPGVAAVAQESLAADFTVTHFDDPPVANAPGVCKPGDCSLRAAVIDANNTPGADTIHVPGGAYKLTRGEGWDQGDASEGDLDITGDVTIQKIGAGSEAIVDANGQATTSRVLDIFGRGRNGGRYSIRVRFEHIAVKNGFPSPDTDGQIRGGGVLVRRGALLDMAGGVVSNNSLANGSGGGGGGIYVEGRLVLDKVVVVTTPSHIAPSRAMRRRWSPASSISPCNPGCPNGAAHAPVGRRAAPCAPLLKKYFEPLSVMLRLNRSGEDRNVMRR